MENAIQEALITIGANENITFSNDAVRTNSATCCGWLEHELGSAQFTLLKTGIYEILFSANVYTGEETLINFVINSNGEALTGTKMLENSVAGEFANISTNRLVRVCANASRTLTIENVGTDAVQVQNVSFIIKKIA